MSDTQVSSLSETINPQSSAADPDKSDTKTLAIVDQLKQAFGPKDEREGIKEAVDEKAAPKAPKKAAPSTKTPAADEQQRRLASIEDARRKRELSAERDATQRELDKYREWEKVKANSKEDPYGALKAMGFESLEEFNAVMLEKGGMSPERKELIEIKQKLSVRDEEAKRAAEAAKQQQLQYTVDKARSEVVSFLQKDERFEFARLNNGPDIVIEVAGQLLAQLPEDQQRQLSREDLLVQAAQHVEDYLEAEFEKLTALNKVKKKFNSKAEDKPSSKSASRQDTPRTLSNKMAATTTSAPNEDSDETRKERFVEEFKKEMARRGFA